MIYPLAALLTCLVLGAIIALAPVWVSLSVIGGAVLGSFFADIEGGS